MYWHGIGIPQTQIIQYILVLALDAKSGLPLASNEMALKGVFFSERCFLFRSAKRRRHAGTSQKVSIGYPWIFHGISMDIPWDIRKKNVILGIRD